MLYESSSSVHKISKSFFPRIIPSFPNVITLSKRAPEQSKTILKMRDRLYSAEKYRLLTEKKPSKISTKTPPKTEKIPMYYSSNKFTKKITNTALKKRLFSQSEKFLSSFKKSSSLKSKKTLKETQEAFHQSILPVHPENSCKRVQLLRDLIKFENSEKKLIDVINEDNDMPSIPIQDRPEYIYYIKRRSQLNFNRKYNSHFVNEIKSDLILNKYNKDRCQKEEDLVNKQKLKIKIGKEMDLEEKDKFNKNNINNEKILKIVKKFLLSKENKLEPDSINFDMNDLYPTFQDKINYFYDSCILPNFKNNFIKIKIDDFESRQNIDFNNYNILLDNNVNKYINKLKIIRQREQDQKQYIEKKKIEYLEILRKRNEEKRLRGEDIDSDEDENEKEDKKFREIFMNTNNNYYDKNKNKRKNSKRKSISVEEINQKEIERRENQYYIEGFFIHKYNMYNKIQIADQRIKDALYNNPNFSVKEIFAFD